MKVATNRARGSWRRSGGRGIVAAVFLAALLSGPALAAAVEKDAGFVSLFDGTSLAGWIGDTDGYAVEDGNLVCIATRGGNLFSAGEYSDFIIRFDFKLPPGGNNGLAIRSPLEGHVATDGMEIQILDDTAPKHANIKPWQHHGSVYGIVPAEEGHCKPVGEWNSEEVTVQGRRVRVVLNGATIVDADLDAASTPETIDQKPHPGLKRDRGHVGFLGHGSRVELRNIRIKDLSAGR